MHYALHMLFHCVALWCAIGGGDTARSAVSPEILANFAKNVASVISPVILGEVQQRNNRSSLQPILTIPIRFHTDYRDSPSTLDNLVDKTTNAANYYERRSNPYPYDRLYENHQSAVGEPRASGGLEQPLPDQESYLRRERPSFQERSSFYNQAYDNFSPNDNLRATEKSVVEDGAESSLDHIEQSPISSPTSQYSAYAGGFGPYGKPYGGSFHGPYGHFPYGDQPDDGGEGSAENNGTYNRGYGPPYGFGPHGFHHGPYGGSPFPYGGFPGPYGPYNRNGNNTNGNGNGRNGNYGYPGPYHDGHDFYGPPGGYGYGDGRNGNGNGNGNVNSRQTEEPAGNGNGDNSTKSGYPHPYGPPLKPFFPFHSFPPPFNILPYDHFKGGPVAGVGHVGYPIFADPFLIGFPFHFPYGPSFHGKKYLPPKPKPADSGETTESTGENTNVENLERITAINQEEVAPAPTSNRYKTSREQKSLKRLGLINLESRKV